MAGRFSDCLARAGITHELEEEEEVGWCVWVHSEDVLVQARQLLDGFVAAVRTVASSVSGSNRVNLANGAALVSSCFRSRGLIDKSGGARWKAGAQG